MVPKSMFPRVQKITALCLKKHYLGQVSAKPWRFLGNGKRKIRSLLFIGKRRKDLSKYSARVTRTLINGELILCPLGPSGDGLLLWGKLTLKFVYQLPFVPADSSATGSAAGSA